MFHRENVVNKSLDFSFHISLLQHNVNVPELNIPSVILSFLVPVGTWTLCQTGTVASAESAQSGGCVRYMHTPSVVLVGRLVQTGEVKDATKLDFHQIFALWKDHCVCV